MNKIDPNINSLKSNPLTIIKPEYKDKTIEDISLERGEEEYIFGKGYIQHYAVRVVKRITADLIRKFSYPFTNRYEAIDFMRSLYLVEDVESHTKEPETTIDKCIEEDKKPCTNDCTEPKNKTFSFGDDDEVNYRAEMRRLRDKPIPTRETGIATKKEKIDSGIF